MDSTNFNLPVGQVEARSVAFSDLDVTKNGRHFDGYAAIYGEETDLEKFIEVILPPAFRSGLANTPNLPMLWDHNGAMPPFATTKAGTLRVEEDRRGLRVQAEIDERHILGPTMMSMAERGELTGMSFGFITGRKDNKVSERAGRMVRAITGFKKLLDVSPTWNPAYAGTSAELRSLSTLGAAALVPEQIYDGEPQSAVDGPDTVEDAADMPTVCETCAKPAEGEDACVCEKATEDAPTASDEQRSGAEPASFDADAHAARTRRLRMLGLSLPR
jgi:HK97 family phage prohead protease